MDDLKAIADELGLCSTASTYIASGNLLFTSAKREAALKRELEAALDDAYGQAAVGVMLRTAREMAQAVERQSLCRRARQSRRRDLPRRAAARGRSADRRATSTDERMALGEREIYVALCRERYGPDRSLRIPAAEAGTARNMNTVAKLAELAREME